MNAASVAAALTCARMTRSIIAIDGPAAAGKGTLARRLAAHFGLPYLDTGLLYRAIGPPRAGRWAAIRPTRRRPRRRLGAACRRISAAPICAARSADAAAQPVAAIPAVRAALLDFQRSFAAERGAVLDGRDIGTVIFPDAAGKLFVTASPEARGGAPLARVAGAGRRGGAATRCRRGSRPRRSRRGARRMRRCVRPLTRWCWIPLTWTRKARSPRDGAAGGGNSAHR